MIDPTTHYVDKEAWTKEVEARPWAIGTFPGASDLIDAWNLRTSGSGRLALTLLYALRAHMRGKVHCHDMTHEEQGAWLRKAEPYLSQLLKPREMPVQTVEVQATA